MPLGAKAKGLAMPNIKISHVLIIIEIDGLPKGRLELMVGDFYDVFYDGQHIGKCQTEQDGINLIYDFYFAPAGC
jgi:hypothetical protein